MFIYLKYGCKGTHSCLVGQIGEFVINEYLDSSVHGIKLFAPKWLSMSAF